MPPPALLRGPGETLPGAEVLDDFPGPAGAMLWLALRDALLWAATAPRDRTQLFADGALARRLALLGRADAGPVPGSAPAALAGLLLRQRDAAQPAEVAAACLEVAAWAVERGAPATGLAFAQAAALATPDDPAPALEAGLLALRRGDEARAESWLRRALALARRAEAVPAATGACLGLGRLYAARGQAAQARRFYVSARRRAWRSGLVRDMAAAMHGLFELARSGATADDADALARGALLRYGAAHPRAAALLRDWIRFRRAGDPGAMVLGGPGEPLPFRGPALARARLLAVVAREAAEAGAAEEFDRAWARAWELLGRQAPRTGGRAGVLLELGRAAATGRRWALAEHAGQRALEAAIAAGEDAERGAAEALLAEVWTGAGGMQWIGSPHGPAAGE
jgi:tetratricopeptide (TPR) repeat protein